MLLLECVIMYHKPDFLNVINHTFYNFYILIQLLVYCSILLIYILSSFDRVYLRFTFLLIVFSLITDITWMALYASSWWNPKISSENPSLIKGFERLCIMLIVLLMVGKIFIGLLLLPLRNIENHKFPISVCGRVITTV
jgi:hypothetical protein